MKNDTAIYIPTGPDASERWDIVAAALRAAGFHDLRPAPMPAQSYTPRHARPQSVMARA